MTLEDSRILFAAAINAFLSTSRLSALEIYAQGNPLRRAEALRFASYIKRHGRPRWFSDVGSR